LENFNVDVREVMLAAEKTFTVPSETVTPAGPSTSAGAASGNISLTTTAIAVAVGAEIPTAMVIATASVTSTTASEGTSKFERNRWWTAIIPLAIVGLFLI
jgi:hypothetical protein